LVPYDLGYATQSKATLNQLLGTGKAKALIKNCGCHAHALTPPHKERRENKQALNRDAGP
jgi:hypothetical protein